MKLKLFYVSLVRSLRGYYVAFLAPDEATVRAHLAEYYGRLWCSVYTEKPKMYPGDIGILREDNPIVLTSPSWE